MELAAVAAVEGHREAQGVRVGFALLAALACLASTSAAFCRVSAGSLRSCSTKRAHCSYLATFLSWAHLPRRLTPARSRPFVAMSALGPECLAEYGTSFSSLWPASAPTVTTSEYVR